MSRSIHATRRQLEEARRTSYAQPQQWRIRMERIGEQLDRKRAIKAQVRDVRHETPPLEALLHVAQIPISVCDEGEYVHYPTSAEDIWAVMRRLPAGTLDGVGRIERCLGEQYQRKALDDEDMPGDLDKPDPLVGRLGSEIVPGVFAGRYLGTYFPASATIRLYAYVYEAALPNQEMLEVYLRLRMLSTLLHEIAHHAQDAIQGRRGRWFAVPGEPSERDAEQREYRWAQQVAAPYLEEAYPEAVQALYDWMAYHGGTSISLATLAEAPVEPGLWSSEIAFENLVEAVHTQEPLKESRLGFAHDLYFAGHDAEALRIIGRVLAEHPHDAEALCLRAHVFIRQKRYAEAEQAALAVVARDAQYARAWEELMHVYAGQGDWAKLEQAAAKVIALNSRRDMWALGERARAWLELGRFAEAMEDIEALAGFQGRGARAQNMARVLQALLALHTGQYEQAWNLATLGLNSRASIWRCVLGAVRFEAAHRLGWPRRAGRLSLEDKEWLREMGYEAWLQRLAMFAD